MVGRGEKWGDVERVEGSGGTREHGERVEGSWEIEDGKKWGVKEIWREGGLMRENQGAWREGGTNWGIKVLWAEGRLYRRVG